MTRSVVVAALVCVPLAACSDGGSDAAPSASKSGQAQPRADRKFNGKTSCTKVRYVGDSVSVGLVSSHQIPKASERLDARFKSVGVKQASIDASGGRSVFEAIEGRPTTQSVLPTSSKGYDGCYFIGLGTNDAANISAGSDHTANQRIDTIMKIVGGRPVLWPLTAADSWVKNDYANANMQKWNKALVAATKRYPNLRVYDWNAERDPKWMEGDGIHDRRMGSRARALMYAKALAVAFPQGMAPNSSKVVGSAWGKPPSRANAVKLPTVEGDGIPFWAGDSAAVNHYSSGPKMK